MAMIFKGEFKTGYDLCKVAELSVGENSHLVQGCLGVSAKNLGEYGQSVYHFEKAYESFAIAHNDSSPFPSFGFIVYLEDLEAGILSALHYSGNIDRCLEWVISFSHFLSETTNSTDHLSI
jgi:hypothetical protein